MIFYKIHSTEIILKSYYSKGILGFEYFQAEVISLMLYYYKFIRNTSSGFLLCVPVTHLYDKVGKHAGEKYKPPNFLNKMSALLPKIC